jgi:hypothetical protein
VIGVREIYLSLGEMFISIVEKARSQGKAATDN